MSDFSLADLAAIIDRRTHADAVKSYTKALLDAGPERCAKKFGEEAVEAVIAAMKGDKADICAESADVIYHLLVLLKVSGLGLEDVMAELERRTAKSGHEEKASRTR